MTSGETVSASPPSAAATPYSLRGFLLYFLKLGATGFGGPVAMITPGPVVITVGFIGYLVAGFEGSCVAALGTLLPCYLFTIIPAPYFRKYGKRPAIAAFVDGVTAAAIGAITGAVVVLGKRSIVDLPTASLALATTGLLAWTKKIPEPLIVLAAAGIGLAAKFAWQAP